MELIPRLLLVGLVLACFANAIDNGIVERPTIASPPPWRGSGVLSYVSSSDAYETPIPSADEYASLEPYSFHDTAYPVPGVSHSSYTPHPQYSAIVTVRTTTWVLSRSTTITSIIRETYYSTLTDIESSVEAGTVTVTKTETTNSPSPADCTTASDYVSVYGGGCSSSSSSSSSSSFSSTIATMTWSPEVTAYPPPSSSDDERASPASTSTTSSASTTTTATPSSGNETPPVVTGGGRPAPEAAEVRTLGVVAALLAVLL
ncbi:uncharacterized protein TrAFT101_009335 [Trichoderma asperellum]|uniref:uncharacterized protein n=1 Tax=Trichoderma asperellum TaxID=101201 RepID=UPI00332EA3BD|nr:hypothetical protein TrAFT101_009335 [Trichoderma asperellum]